MEKETKRYLLRILDTMLEQERSIQALARKVMPSSSISSDSVENRIERMAQEVGKLECFSINWTALCEKRLATRVSEDLDS